SEETVPSPGTCLLCADPSLPRPSISLSPTGVTAPGANVTIRCQGQRRNVTFFLHKPRDRNPQRHVASGGDWAEFLITTVGRQQGGNYSCSYRPQSEPFISSEPSNPVQLVVAGEGPGSTSPLPAPHPARPSRGAPYVTIRCQGQRRDVRFFLHKAGDLNPQQHMDPAGDGAEFRITTVGRQHGGSYSCSYRLHSEPFVFSEPSDPVKLVVAGEGPGSASPLPAPPPTRPSWGGSMLLGCWEPGSALSPGPSRGDARPGSGDDVGGRYNRPGKALPSLAGAAAEGRWAVVGQMAGAWGWGLLWPSTGLGSPGLAGAAGALGIA
uniref:Uncharacterized protein n=1 Tax=Terrapene triunguis TaxID=2587831 RepID=A0A674IUV5_9SAUR